MIPALLAVAALAAHINNPHLYWWSAVIAAAGFHAVIAFEAWVGPPAIPPG